MQEYAFSIEDFCSIDGRFPKYAIGVVQATRASTHRAVSAMIVI